MRIAILGAGAMGCLFGARLALASQDVTMVAHRQESAEVLLRGIYLTLDGTELWAPVKASLAQDLRDPFDLVILFTKTMASKSALDSVQHLLGSGCLLSLQNGIGNERLLEEYVDVPRALVGVTNFPSDLVSTGRVVSHSTGQVRLGPADGVVRPAAEEVAALLDGAGLNASLEPDIQVAIWEKAAFNACQNAICAICGVPCGGIPRAPEGLSLSRAIVHETAAVAHAYGVAMDEERAMRTVERSLVDYADHYPSMAQDVRHGRRTEIGAINGRIVEYAHAKGMDVPYTEAVLDLVRVIEANA